MPLLQPVEHVLAMNFMTQHVLPLDSVRLKTCVGHCRDVPLSLPSPPDLDTTAFWKGIVPVAHLFWSRDVKSERSQTSTEVTTCMHRQGVQVITVVVEEL